MIQLRDLLLEPPFPNGTAHYMTLPGAGHPTLTTKTWAADYEEVQVAEEQLLVDPSLEAINALFGDEDGLDRELLNQNVYFPQLPAEVFQTEGDSSRAFSTHVGLPVYLALRTSNGTQFIAQRSESGPLGSTNVNQTVDLVFNTETDSLVVVEFKKHGIIDTERWTNQRQANKTRLNLGKEMRG